MPDVLKSYVAIRFNLKAGFTPQSGALSEPANLDRDWLDERLYLFDRFCAYSLEHQTFKDFTVVIGFDPSTDRGFIEKVCNCAPGVKIVPLYAPSTGEFQPRLNDFLRADSSAEFVAVTRLDNDDALAPTYLHLVRERVQEVIAAERVPAYIVFPQGQNYDVGTQTYTRHHYVMAAFGTLVERRLGDLKGVYSAKHTKMDEAFKTEVVKTRAAQWCIVVHDNNVLNTLRGRVLGKPSFLVGRPGTAERPRTRRQANIAPRTVENFIRFLTRKPLNMQR